MNRFLALLGLFAFIATSAASTPQRDAERHIQQIQRALAPVVYVKGETAPPVTLASRMAAVHVPAVSIAVIHAGRIDWARGFGVTRVNGPPVTPRTLFEAGSVSKSLTALGVLHLVASGRLNLDADANEYLTSWKIPANSFTAKQRVTLRELLSHTAGTTVHGFPGYPSDAKLPTLIQVLNGEPPANSPAIRVDVAPGTLWRYSGGGYVIVQQLLQDVTGRPFSVYMRDSVLVPLGMLDSTYEQPLPRERMAEVALPYRSNGESVKGGPHIYPEEAPAGLWTTPSDLARYVIGVQHALAGRSNQILSTALTKIMVTPVMSDYGLGLQIGGSQAKPYFEHSGVDEGYITEVLGYQNGDGAVIMTDGDNGGQLIGEIRRTVAHEYDWPDFQPPTRSIVAVDPERFDALAGSYQLAPNFTLTFTREGRRFLSQATGQQQVEIFPEGEHEYFTKVVDAQITFDVDEQGRATGIVLHQDGRNAPGKRLDDATAKRIAAALALSNRRFREQVPAPGGDTVLRRLLEGDRNGTPDYQEMSPGFAAITRQQLPNIQQALSALGAVSAVTFKEVSPAGADVYRVTFERGRADFGLSFDVDGKIAGASYQPLD
jgi:CubicO group peptidase (beta-lactamase class C family)